MTSMSLAQHSYCFASTHKDIVKTLSVSRPLVDDGEQAQSDGDDDEDEDNDDNECINPKCNGKCTTCLGCILKMLVEYRFHCN